MEVKVKVQRMHPDAKLPYYDHEGDAGLAMHTRQGGIIQPGERQLFYCGWGLEFSPEYVAYVRDRSGMSVKQGLKQLGGVFDSNYRGEYNVCLHNLSDEPYEVKAGDKIAQLVIMPFVQAELEEVAQLSDSERGESGFGSTGR